ncbi:MAG TPA: class I SAM-dependent methyltransferase [Methanoregulaceae archaeon]|nr:class I SAM-dependent methyltransferase [Methanoregulaceae archaeon]
MIPKRQVFDEHATDYDRWFDENKAVYDAQLRILKDATATPGPGLEIGVGSGRFAAPLGIGYGIDPSRRLLTMAKGRGIDVVEGTGEHLPFHDGAFRVVLMMTVICFLDDPPRVFREAGRVLSGGSRLVAGFIEKDGEIEKAYRNEETKGRFLRFARFWTADEVLGYFRDAGFSDITLVARVRGFCVVRGTNHE